MSVVNSSRVDSTANPNSMTLVIPNGDSFNQYGMPNESNSQCPLVCLPDDAINYIGTFLDVPAILSLGQTCRPIHQSLQITHAISFPWQFQWSEQRIAGLFRMVDRINQVPVSSENPSKPSFFVSRDLHTFSLYFCRLQGDEFKSLLEKFPQLGSLSLHYPRFQLPGQIQIGDPWTQAIATCRSLNTLNLSSDHRWITDQALLAIAEACTNLGILALAGDPVRGNGLNVTDTGIKAIFQLCRHLEKFELSYCDQVTGEGIEAIDVQCPNLHTLDFNKCGITDQGLEAILQCCPNFRTLCLSGCARITDQGLQAIARQGANLETFELNECFANDQLTDQGVKAVVERCSRLRNLRFRMSTRVTDQWLQAIAEFCKNLWELKLCHCPKVTKDGIKLILQHCKDLQSLDLSGNEITDRGLEEILPYCQNLCTLKLRKCQQISERGVQAVLQSCKKLEILELPDTSELLFIC